jgi:hypothetical protein
MPIKQNNKANKTRSLEVDQLFGFAAVKHIKNRRQGPNKLRELNAKKRKVSSNSKLIVRGQF